MKKIYNLTKLGKQELEQELVNLKSQRPAIAERLALARDFGDLSENEEYSNARAEQKVLENRITEIEEILKNVKIISSTGSKTGKVGLGSTVTLSMKGGKKVKYTLVGAVEANPLEAKISNESPLGSALMKKSAGDEVTITTPTGETIYKVLEVE